MSSNTTFGRLYLTALKSLERLEIQFVPTGMIESRRANYGDIEVVGRNNPIPHYTGGSDTLEFELDFVAEDDNREDVVRKCRWLKSMSMNDGFGEPPEKIRLTWGRMFQDEIWVIRAVQVTYGTFNVEEGFLPVQAYVRLSLQLAPKENLTRRAVQWQ